ncbi:SH2 domain [Trinorchestia longiramus]|nr:SH2 domain [Trinorchestia longiramus]
MVLVKFRDHKLKGVDPKPRISLVEDPDTHFTSVIHTPLPPTPCSTSTSVTSNNNFSLYSSVRKKSSSTPRSEEIYSPVKSKSVADFPQKKTSASADSLLNSNRRLPNTYDNNNHQNSSSSRHSNLSITNHYNSSPPATSPTGHAKSFSSNPNILSGSGSLAPTNSPTSPSYHTRSNSIQPLHTPNYSHRGQKCLRHNSLSHHPSEDHSYHHPHTVNGLNRPTPNRSSHTTKFLRSRSTRDQFLPETCGRGLPSSGSEQNIVAPSGRDVIFRDHSINPRQSCCRRAANASSLTGPKMSLNYDSGLSLECTDSEDPSHQLEWELSLESTDLRSHAWYHGNIPRARAEEVILNEGQFLVRDCTTQPGNFVLSCMWDAKILHFVIQMTLVQPDTVYERIQYELEDDSYDTIPDLICAYVGNKKIVTKATGAKILSPVNRTKSLSYYESLYKKETFSSADAPLGDLGPGGVPPSKPAIHRMYDNRQPPTVAALREGVGCSIVRSSLTDVHQARKPSQEGILGDERSNSSDGIIGHRPRKDLTASTQSLPRRIQGGKTDLSLPPSAPLTPAESGTDLLKPPPKPSRVPSFKVKARKPAMHVTDRVYAEIDEKEEADEGSSKQSDGFQGSPGSVGTTEQNPRFSRLSEVYHPSGSDSGNGSGDSIQTTVSDARNRDSQSSLVEEGVIAPLEDDSLAEDTPPFTVPDMNPPSYYNLETFSTLLLPHIENPPLDATALNGIRNAIMENGSRVIAAHLTYADLEVLNGLPTQDFGLGVTLGIEMITLPQGSQLRKDLIERTECLRLLVAVTILKEEDIRLRAELIHRWIQIAIDTKTATGNLYGFNNIMLGLCNPQIQRLTATWHMVRQKFTDSAFSFESKLRSTLKAMNECNNPQAPNTIIPHILPFMVLCERDLEDIYSLRRKDESLLQWEASTSDYGLQMLLMHLLDGRSFAHNLTTYRRNAELILDDPDTLEDLVLDVFRTEFHLKFLFGSRGALRDAQERHAKFQQILTALSAHCESSVESAV